MMNRVGPWLVWMVFLLTVWFWARPVMVFVAAVLIVGLIIYGAIRELEGGDDGKH